MQYINDNYHCLSQGPSSSTADGPMEQAAASLNLLYVKVFLKYVPFHRKCKLFFADSAFYVIDALLCPDGRSQQHSSMEAVALN